MEPESEDKWPTPVPGGLCTTRRFVVDEKAAELYDKSVESHEAAIAAFAAPPTSAASKGKGKGKAAQALAGSGTATSSWSGKATDSTGAGAAAAHAGDDNGHPDGNKETRKTPPRIEMAHFSMDSMCVGWCWWCACFRMLRADGSSWRTQTPNVAPPYTCLTTTTAATAAAAIATTTHARARTHTPTHTHTHTHMRAHAHTRTHARTHTRIHMCRYSSPFPEQFRRLPCVYVCEYTLRFMKSRGELQQHVADFRQNGHRPCPPGEEVYRHGNLSVWEIDGRRHRVYCQNLCLVTTLFLETKTLFYGVDAFLFYVLAEWTDTGATILGCVAVVAVSRPMLAVWCFFSREVPCCLRALLLHPFHLSFNAQGKRLQALFYLLACGLST